MSQVIIQQDIYQSENEWKVQVKFAEQIIDAFPTLSKDSVIVLSKAILNKLSQGVVYPEEIEKMISIVFPKILETLREKRKK